MRFEDYKSVIDQLEQMGCLHLAFTGGDPFVHPDFLDVFEYAREKGFVCDIYTNGIALASDDVLFSRIARLKPRAFYLSLYGSSGDGSLPSSCKSCRETLINLFIVSTICTGIRIVLA